MSWRKRAVGRTTLEYPGPGYYVYVAWGMDRSRALYVGKTRAFHPRMAGHERQSPWFPYLRTMDLYAYSTEEQALIAEAEAIRDLKPEYNQVGNAGKLPPMVRYLRHRKAQPLVTYGSEITTEQISAKQLAVIARVQRLGRPSTEDEEPAA